MTTFQALIVLTLGLISCGIWSLVNSIDKLVEHLEEISKKLDK